MALPRRRYSRATRLRRTPLTGRCARGWNARGRDWDRGYRLGRCGPLRRRRGRGSRRGCRGGHAPDNLGADRLGGHHEHPADTDPLLILQCPAIELNPPNIEGGDLVVEQPIAEVALREDRQTVARPDHHNLGSPCTSFAGRNSLRRRVGRIVPLIPPVAFMSPFLLHPSSNV
jgi:hypothetical protein